MVSRLERQLYYQYSDAIPCGFPQGFLVQINDSLLSSKFEATFCFYDTMIANYKMDNYFHENWMIFFRECFGMNYQVTKDSRLITQWTLE